VSFPPVCLLFTTLNRLGVHPVFFCFLGITLIVGTDKAFGFLVYNAARSSRRVVRRQPPMSLETACVLGSVIAALPFAVIVATRYPVLLQFVGFIALLIIVGLLVVGFSARAKR